MRDIRSAVQMMRDLSLSENADELMHVVGRYLRDSTPVNRALVISRLDLPAPRYRVERRAEWDAQQDRFIETQPRDIREGGVLAELLYAGEPRLIADLSIPMDESDCDLLREQKSLMAFPVFDKGLVAGAVILLFGRGLLRRAGTA